MNSRLYEPSFFFFSNSVSTIWISIFSVSILATWWFNIHMQHKPVLSLDFYRFFAKPDGPKKNRPGHSHVDLSQASVVPELFEEETQKALESLL